MKLMRQFVTASIVTGAMLLPVGGVLADNVSVDSAGPNSSQDITINNSSSVVKAAVNTIEVTNANSQQATTGDVGAVDNTSVGDLNSGPAENSNGTTTTVAVDNQADVPGGNGAAGGSATSTGGTGASTGSVLGSTTSAGGVGGAQTAATLPVTGSSQFVDVSALRAAWHATTGTPAAAVIQQTRASSQFMFTVATLLSVLGAMANVAYLRRKEGRS